MKINITLEELIRDFNSRDTKSKSMNKDTLINDEINCYEFIFNSEPNGMYYGGTFAAQLPEFNNRFSEYSENFSDYEIFLIKKAYTHFIVNGADISEAGKWYQNSFRNFSVKTPRDLHEEGTSFVQAVIIYYYYLSWLKEQLTIRTKKMTEKECRDTMEKACKGLKEYAAVREWFIQSGFCDPETFKWNKKKFTLSTLAGYLKDLYNKGYTKKKLTHMEIQSIAKNSFNAEMSIHTIKRAKISTPEIPHCI